MSMLTADRRSTSRDTHSRIDNTTERVVTAHNYRIEVELRDAVHLAHELREAQDQLFDEFDVDALFATHALEQRKGADAAHHFTRVGICHGQDAEHDVAQNLHVTSTHSEHHQRP